MRRFYLQRTTDQTGVSGTGRVLEGVETASGRVFVEWRPPRPTLGIYDSIEQFLDIHVRSHPDATEMVWVDEERS
jgi:hypothetical protein